jgi:hypothetical protein
MFQAQCSGSEISNPDQNLCKRELISHLQRSLGGFIYSVDLATDDSSAPEITGNAGRGFFETSDPDTTS